MREVTEDPLKKHSKMNISELKETPGVLKESKRYSSVGNAAKMKSKLSKVKKTK
jgi:hypothetical protein